MKSVVGYLGPMLYALLFGIGCILYFIDLRLPTTFLSSIHYYISYVLATCCVVSYCVTSNLDCGVIKPSNVELQYKYPRQEVLYPRNTICLECNLVRIPRSKHCKSCNVCVARFSHHCFWFNKCIGQDNYKYFIIFLFLHVITCAYAIFVITGLMMAQVENSQDAMKQLRHEFLARKNRGLLVVASVSFVAVPLVGSFLLFHLYLILTNVTAYEWYKRGILLEDLQRRRPVLDNSWGGVMGSTKVDIITVDGINYNPYNLNAWENVKDALFQRKFKQG